MSKKKRKRPTRSERHTVFPLNRFPIELFDELQKEPNDHAAAIVSGSYLDYVFEEFLRLRLREGDETKQLFEWVGPLGTHGARLRVAFATGIIDRGYYDELSTINTIRNMFAHEIVSLIGESTGEPLTFSSTEIVELCNGLASYKDPLFGLNVVGSRSAFLYAVVFLITMLHFVLNEGRKELYPGLILEPYLQPIVGIPMPAKSSD